jgi:hypothetical protein
VSDELTGLPRAVVRLDAVAGLARRALMARGGIRAVCAAAGRARAATLRPREDSVALPNISICRRPRTARPRRPLRIDRRLSAAWIAAWITAGRRGSRAHSGGSPSSSSLGSQSESSAAVPARTGRGDRITAAVGRPPVAEGSASVWLSEWGVSAWWGRRGLGTKWGRQGSGCG